MLLTQSGIERVIDIRLNNRSQMAGFTKKDDLQYFLYTITGIDYVHLPILAPTKEVLEQYRNDKDWELFEKKFRAQMEETKPFERIDISLFTEKVCCLLCSEPEADCCHRRLVAEYLSRQIDGPIEIVHL